MKKIINSLFVYKTIFWISVTISTIVLNIVNFIVYEYRPFSYVLGVLFLTGTIVGVTLLAIVIAKREKVKELFKILLINGDADTFKENIQMLTLNHEDQSIFSSFEKQIVILTVEIITDYQNLNMQTFTTFETKFNYILNNHSPATHTYFIIKTMYMALTKKEDYLKYYNALIPAFQEDLFTSQLREAALYVYKPSEEYSDNGIINYWQGQIKKTKMVRPPLKVPVLHKILLPVFILNVLVLVIVAVTKNFLEINLEYQGEEYLEYYEEYDFPFTWPQREDLYQYEKLDFFYKLYDTNKYHTPDLNDDSYYELLVLKLVFTEENYNFQVSQDNSNYTFYQTDTYKDYIIYKIEYNGYCQYNYDYDYTYTVIVNDDCYYGYYCLNPDLYTIIYINCNILNYEQYEYNKIFDKLPNIW